MGRERKKRGRKREAEDDFELTCLLRTTSFPLIRVDCRRSHREEKKRGIGKKKKKETPGGPRHAFLTSAFLLAGRGRGKKVREPVDR